MAALDERTGTSTFGTAAFWIIQAGGVALPFTGRTARYQRDPIPYGTAVTIQLGGGDDAPLAFTALLKTEDWPLLRTLVGTAQTLAILGEDARRAVLVQATDPKAYAEGYLTVAVQFVS